MQLTRPFILVHILHIIWRWVVEYTRWLWGGSSEIASATTNGARPTDTLATEYMTTASDDTVRENVEANRTFFDLITLTIIPRLLLYLR